MSNPNDVRLDICVIRLMNNPSELNLLIALNILCY